MNTKAEKAAAYKAPQKKQPPKPRLVTVTDPAEIGAIKRAGLEDPIGAYFEGRWLATAHSLDQWRHKPFPDPYDR